MDEGIVFDTTRELFMSTKERVIKAIQDLPQDASIKDAMEKLYLLYKIERGIKQADTGKKISQKEAKESTLDQKGLQKSKRK